MGSYSADWSFEATFCQNPTKKDHNWWGMIIKAVSEKNITRESYAYMSAKEFTRKLNRVSSNYHMDYLCCKAYFLFNQNKTTHKETKGTKIWKKLKSLKFYNLIIISEMSSYMVNKKLKLQGVRQFAPNAQARQ